MTMFCRVVDWGKPCDVLFSYQSERRAILRRKRRMVILQNCRIKTHLKIIRTLCFRRLPVLRMRNRTVQRICVYPGEVFIQFQATSRFKGPLKYLVAKLHRCYPVANSLPVCKKFFARFFRRRPVADSSRCLTFSLRCNKHKKILFAHIFID